MFRYAVELKVCLFQYVFRMHRWTGHASLHLYVETNLGSAHELLSCVLSLGGNKHTKETFESLI